MMINNGKGLEQHILKKSAYQTVEQRNSYLNLRIEEHAGDSIHDLDHHIHIH